MTSIASDTLFYVEIILISLFIVMQLVYAGTSRRDAVTMERLFPEDWLVIFRAKFLTKKANSLTKEDLSELVAGVNVDRLEQHDFDPKPSLPVEDTTALVNSMLEDAIEDKTAVLLLKPPKQSSNTFLEIVSKLNLYLLRNKQSQLDFSIVKEIVERECDSKEEQAYNGLQMPLYWGLLGTILGITIGLAALLLPASGDQDSALGLIGGEKVNKLLMAVSIAMAGSFTGLLFTIRATLRNKKAVAKLHQNKHDFYHFLQTELLPTLPKNMGGVVERFQQVVNGFNSSFSKNLQAFDQNIGAVHANLSEQKAFLNQIANLELNDIVQGNIQVLQELQKSAKHFKQFIAYQEGLNFTIDKVNNASGTLAKTGERMQGVISELELLKANSKEIAKTLGAQQTLFQHVNDLFESDTNIVKAWKTKVRKEIENLDKVMQDNLEALEEHSVTHFANVKKVMEKEFLHLEKTFEDSQTRFDDLAYLKHLEKLEQIKEGLAQSSNIQLKKELLEQRAEQEKTNRLLEELIILQKESNTSVLQDLLKKIGYGKKKK